MRKIFTSTNVIIIFLILGFLFAAVFVVKDREAIVLALANMRPLTFFLVLIFTALSYYFMCTAFTISTKQLGVDLPYKTIFNLAYISTVISNLVSIAGITGYTTKVAIFKKHDLRISQITAFTFFFGNLSNIALLVLLPFGIESFLSVQSVSNRITSSVRVEIFIAILALILAYIAVFIGPLRRWVLGFILKFVRNGDTKEKMEARIVAVNEALDAAVAVLREKPGKVIYLAVLTSLNWLFAILALGACFYAIGIAVPFGVLITGFTIGSFVGLISIIPGGMGIQEATMAGVFSFLGINFGVAVLAAMLFRLFYHVIPFAYGMYLSERMKITSNIYQSIQPSAEAQPQG